MDERELFWVFWHEGLSLPTRILRALAGAGVTSLKSLQKFCVHDILELHGIGTKYTDALEERLAQKNMRLQACDCSYERQLWADGKYKMVRIKRAAAK